MTRTATYLGNAQRTGVFDAPGVRESPHVQWEFTTEGPIASSPVAAEGKVYFGSDDGRLYCLEADSGKSVWRFETGGPVKSSPTVWEGRVCFGNSEGWFYALDAATGQERVRFEAWGDAHSAAAVAEGIACFWSKDSSGGPQDSEDEEDDLGDCLYALDLDTGKCLWRRGVYGYTADTISAAIDDGVVYVCEMADGHNGALFHAFALHTGKTLWQHHDIVGFLTAAVSGDLAFCGSFAAYTSALDKKTGSKRGHLETVAPTCGLAIDGNTLYLVGEDKGQEICLQAVTMGEDGTKFDAVQWQQPLEQSWEDFSLPNVVSVAGDVVYVFWGALLFAFDAAVGRPLWQHEAPEAITANVFPSPSGLLVAAGSTLYAIG